MLRRWRVTLLAATAWGLLLLAWLPDTQGEAAWVRGPARLLLPVALLLAVAALVERLRWLRPPRTDSPFELLGFRRGRAVLAGLLALALMVRFVGIDHEVEERSYRDEGTYWHHATEINDGELIRRSFVYPHLTYEVYAFALWSADLHPRVWPQIAALWGVDEPVARDWLLLRSLVALLSALTVWPVFGIAWRIVGAGPLGVASGAVAGLLFVFSPLFNDGSHLIIADVPSACLAAFALLFVAGLLEREELSGYLAAGIFAGLAAATKYPAGTVAVAIVAVWLRWRWQEWRQREARHDEPNAPAVEGAPSRTWPRRLGLLWAGLASVAVFVAVMPSLFVHFRHALFGGRGIFFGVRQYAGGGWIGVRRDSNALYYLDQLGDSFGWLALLGGLVGAVALARPARRRWLWMAVFPVVYLLLLSNMSMVVARNLHPLIPATSALLGVGLVALVTRLGELRGVLLPVAAALTGVVLLLPLAQPVATTLIDAASLAAPSTRERAASWMVENLPPGARVLHEEYTPKPPPDLFDPRRIRFAARLAPRQIENRGFDVVVLAKNAWGRFFDQERADREHHRTYRQRYERMRREWPLLHVETPSRTRRGPEIELRAVPAPPASATGAITPEQLFVPDGDMRGGDGAAASGSIRFDRPGQWLGARFVLPAGPVEITVRGSDLEPAGIELRGWQDPVDVEPESSEESALRMAAEVPEDARYWLRLYLAQGAVVTGIEWRATGDEPLPDQPALDASGSAVAVSPATERAIGDSISSSSSSRVVR